MPHVVVEDRCLSAVAHLAYARTQNSGTGILGNNVIYRAASRERLCFFWKGFLALIAQNRLFILFVGLERGVSV